MSLSQRYKLEFTLHVYNTSLQAVKNALAEFGDKFNIQESSGSQEKGSNFIVNMSTEEPALVFDICSQFGRIRTVKIDEEGV
jgi:dihydroxyacetone kinase-like predicted kinase